MIRIVLVGALGAAIGAGAWLAERRATAAEPNLDAQVRAAPGPTMSRREHIARIVAETSARTAEKTALEVIARKASPGEPERTAVR